MLLANVPTVSCNFPVDSQRVELSIIVTTLYRLVAFKSVGFSLEPLLKQTCGV